jgi:hypothetical protein
MSQETSAMSSRHRGDALRQPKVDWPNGVAADREITDPSDCSAATCSGRLRGERAIAAFVQPLCESLAASRRRTSSFVRIGRFIVRLTSLRPIQSSMLSPHAGFASITSSLSHTAHIFDRIIPNEFLFLHRDTYVAI